VKPYGAIAIEFASALVDGDFVQAHELLAPDLREQLPPAVLRESYFAMFRGYTDQQPASIWYDEQFWLEDWPAKEPGDMGVAYVGLQGDGFVEAVTVTVASFGGVLLIREVEWGRP
jgi:hypothetical protein